MFSSRYNRCFHRVLGVVITRTWSQSDIEVLFLFACPGEYGQGMCLCVKYPLVKFDIINVIKYQVEVFECLGEEETV